MVAGEAQPLAREVAVEPDPVLAVRPEARAAPASAERRELEPAVAAGLEREAVRAPVVRAQPVEPDARGELRRLPLIGQRRLVRAYDGDQVVGQLAVAAVGRVR